MAKNEKKKRVWLTGGFVVLALTAVLAFTGCSLTIAAIKDNPGKYAGQDVTLSGQVGKVIKIPLTKLVVFELKDNTGAITVISAKDKSEGQTVLLDARVVGFDGTSESAEKNVEVLTQFLVDREIVSAALAEKVAKTAVGTIKNIAESAQGSFFLIEL